MAELEIHHEEAHTPDPMGRRVGILAAGLAVLLAVVTIASHRTHTAAIMHKSSANDAWAHYQATRMKSHTIELGEDMVRVFGNNSDATRKMLNDYAGQTKKYEMQGRDIQHEAEDDDHAAENDEHRALRYDIGEGLLEIGLVLSSLYFIARRNMFPLLGLIAGIAGIAIAASGLRL